MCSNFVYFILILIIFGNINAKTLPGSKLNIICKWPGEYDPCLQLHLNTKDRIKNKCCNVGCNIEETKEACCFTQECLNRCYPGKSYIAGDVF
uniref:Uncharacterized protein n=1 Tax=Meloidogyne enterolobii TaxID=390850 RepID=A0A6V7V007_MELEN|nr:unnamed protein product [Meloidogyne enterolobii]